MSIDLKRTLIYTAVISALMIGFLCFRNSPSDSEIESRARGKEEVIEILNEAGDILTGEKHRRVEQQHDRIGLYITNTEPETLDTERPSGKPEVTEDSKGLVLIGADAERTAIREPIDIKTTESEPTGPTNIEETTIAETTPLDIQREREKTIEFLGGILSWGNLNTNATQARIEAAKIREDAKTVREQAESAKPEIREEMLRRANLMESYANRISATRGNKQKMRILLYDVEHDIQNRTTR